MKAIFQILIFFFSFSLVLLSQTIKEHSINSENDSSKIKSSVKNIEQILVNFDEFELYHKFYDYKNQISLDNDPNTVWLKTSVLVSKYENFSQDFSPYFLGPLEQKYQRDSKFNLFRYALGMIQTGAAGYLAYKHIKKYGLRK
ncbi:MAG: hypothetical protein ROY99_02470 [Ignavibacterium sp.]|nr:hypothetical protein [Ignavibacterium sp.]